MSEIEDSDIYRGEPPVANYPESTISSSSSSSSNSSIFGGRLGAIPVHLALAITRWARGNSSSSSSSSSSSGSSQSSRHRRHRPSHPNLHAAQSERDLTARLKAREESRQLPREFSLYLPPSLSRPQQQARTGARKHRHQSERVTITSHLPAILLELDAALKKSTKARRNQDRNRNVNQSAETSTQAVVSLHHDYMLPGFLKTPSRPPSFTDLSSAHRPHKGKQRATDPPSLKVKTIPKAWWLDVCSPDWSDMRAIGKLLHLHPLTLEDILQQDPREKLETFPRLGYYFIAFRAIESKNTRQRLRDLHLLGNMHTGQIGEANIYLVVFKEGICSFHFSDIAEHTDRVRNRILLLEHTVDMSSDWIAHGILDSVVDSFFPFIEEIEKEVMDIDDLVYSDDVTQPHQEPDHTAIVVEDGDPPFTFGAQTKFEFELQDMGKERVKNLHPGQFRPPAFSLTIRRLRKSIQIFKWAISQVDAQSTDSKIYKTLFRIARMRRLVTSLTRLLAAKSDVIAQIRKRLDGELEFGIYMADIQDHILTLQHSLAHYERMLSQSHPTYISQLRASAEKTAKAGPVLFLSIVSIGVLCIQTLIGLFSMNAPVPTNAHLPNSPFNVFGIIIGIAVAVLSAYLLVVRVWWRQAKRMRGSL